MKRCEKIYVAILMKTHLPHLSDYTVLSHSLLIVFTDFFHNTFYNIPSRLLVPFLV